MPKSRLTDAERTARSKVMENIEKDRIRDQKVRDDIERKKLARGAAGKDDAFLEEEISVAKARRLAAEREAAEGEGGGEGGETEGEEELVTTVDIGDLNKMDDDQLAAFHKRVVGRPPHRAAKRTTLIANIVEQVNANAAGLNNEE